MAADLYARIQQSQKLQAMLIPASLDRLLPLLDVMADALQVFRTVEPRLLQVIQQALHGTNRAIHRRRFLVAPDGHEEERYELETVVQDGVYPILLIALRLADHVQLFHLFDELVVVGHDILRLDICAAVEFEDAEMVADGQDAIEDGLFLGIGGQAIRW